MLLQPESSLLVSSRATFDSDGSSGDSGSDSDSSSDYSLDVSELEADLAGEDAEDDALNAGDDVPDGDGVTGDGNRRRAGGGKSKDPSEDVDILDGDADETAPEGSDEPERPTDQDQGGKKGVRIVSERAGLSRDTDTDTPETVPEENREEPTDQDDETGKKGIGKAKTNATKTPGLSRDKVTG